MHIPTVQAAYFKKDWLQILQKRTGNTLGGLFSAGKLPTCQTVIYLLVKDEIVVS